MCKQVEKDASFKIAEMSSRAGRSFVGLCSLLTEFEVRRTLLPFEFASVIDNHNHVYIAEDRQCITMSGVAETRES